MQISRGLPRLTSATRAGIAGVAAARVRENAVQQRGGGGVIRDTRAAGVLPCSAVLYC